jgi:hypothetical protein
MGMIAVDESRLGSMLYDGAMIAASRKLARQ